MSISDLSQDLCLITLIQELFIGTITPVWVPFIVFIVTAAITIFIGYLGGHRH
mgnify:CR=1 FL=1